MERRLNNVRLELRFLAGTLDIPEKVRPLTASRDILHTLVSENPIGEIDPLDDEAMKGAFAKFTTPDSAIGVVSALNSHWWAKNPQVGAVPGFGGLFFEHYFCPIVEWIENDDKKVVGIFNIENPQHYGWLPTAVT